MSANAGGGGAGGASAGGAYAGGAYDWVRGEALRTIERDRLDPGADPGAVRTAVTDAVEAYQRRAHLGDATALRDPLDMADRVLRSITEFGPLTDLLASPDVEEVFIEGDRVAYLDRSGRLQALAAPTTEAENRQVIERLLATTQRRLDTANPLVQARVLQGSARLTAAIPPVADRLSATLRRYTLRRETLPGLVERGSLTPAAAGFLWAVMQSTSSLLVSGPPGAGKTSLLAALIAAVPPDRCVRSCEEIRELAVPLTHGSFYETRPAGLDGTAEITLRQLVRFVLAMRPDHIVVGEVRGAEAFELTRAVNAGCGLACTIHANSARHALVALTNAAIMAGENVREPVVRKVFATALDLVVHCDLDDPAQRDRLDRSGPEGLRRQVTEIIAVVPSLHDDFSTEPVFHREALGKPLEWTGIVPAWSDRIDRRLPDGFTLRAVLDGRRAPL